MIQRIQTIWFFLAGVAALATLKLPYYSGIKDPAVKYSELNALTATIPTLLVTLLIAIIAFIAIGLFKNRTLQLRLSVAGIALEGLLIFLYYHQVSEFAEGNLALTSILHMLIVLFFMLAARGVNKDEKLIKDSNRLR